MKWILFFIFCYIVATCAIIGKLNQLDFDECKKSGHSDEICAKYIYQ